MKNFLFTILVIIIAAHLLNADMIKLGSAQTRTGIIINTETQLKVNLEIENINTFSVDADNEYYTRLSIPGFSHSTVIGEPELPVLRKIISVPWGAEVKINIEGYSIEEFNLADQAIFHPVIPAQPSLSKAIDPCEIDFKISQDAYLRNDYNDQELVQVEELGIMRGHRLFLITVQPVNYNPVANSIKIHNNLTINLDFTGGDLEYTAWQQERTFSPDFESVYRKSIFNYRSLSSRDVLTSYPMKYVIISDPMFEDQLQPFIAWKIRSGYETIVAYTDDIGTTTTLIKNFIQDLYDAGAPDDPAPTYVLLVGDVSEIPAYSGSTGSHVTDLNYVKLDGADYYPEMYYARFSARNTGELQPQIDKTLEYEQFLMPDPAFLGEVVMIAGMDSYHGATWANGQINYGTTYYFNEDHGILSHTYLYPQSGSNSGQIISDVSNGVGYVNYTAHGGPTSWSDPSFTIANINSLQNEGKYPLVVGNCCLTNKFETGECFGEAWLRAENKGAIGYIGGTNSTYWDEDYWWGVGAGAINSNPTYEQTGQGAYDGLFHDHDEAFEDWYTTAMAMIYCGNMAVVEGGSGMINYYWEIYSLMGDPSLSAYLGVPAENSVSTPDIIFIGLGTADIYAEPYSYVALTRDEVICATALIGSSGMATLEFSPFTTPGEADIVITRQNRQPYISTIQIIPNDGPYLVIDDYTPLAGNDDYIETGEDVLLTIALNNVGTENAEDVTVTIISDDQFITITDDTEYYGLVYAGNTLSIENGFAFNVSDLAPDLHPLQITAVITSDGGAWTENMSLMIYEPNVFSVDPESFYQEIGENEIIFDNLTITNTTDRIVNYTIRTEEIPGRNLGDSYVVCSTDNFNPGETTDWVFTVYNNSPDDEWVTDVNILFPTGVTVNSATNFVGGNGGDMIYDQTTGEAVQVNWHGETSLGYGVLHDGQSAVATVNVTTSTEFAGNITLGYQIIGDGYGVPPHIVEGTMELSYPLSWISLASSSGTLNGGESHTIEVTFNSEGLELGIYNCSLFISDGDSRDYKRIPVTLAVISTESEDDIVTSGNVHLGNYPNPFNPITTISFSVEQDVDLAALEIYNMRGQIIRSFEIDTSSSQPVYQVVWNGTDDQGREVTSGIYFSKIKTGRFTSTKKMILMK